MPLGWRQSSYQLDAGPTNTQVQRQPLGVGGLKKMRVYLGGMIWGMVTFVVTIKSMIAVFY